MKDVTGSIAAALTLLLLLLVRSAGAMDPDRGYCIGTWCYTAFGHGADFAAAQTQCEERAGRLMTVRSSVSNDILQILLENQAGRYWIGLRRARSACAAAADDEKEGEEEVVQDPESGLRGFQWVTGESQSDFYNWTPGLEDSCASSLCVTVSKNTHFEWVPEPCDAQVDGFLCEYNFQSPCSSLAVSPGESVIYTINYGFRGEDVVSSPAGSIAVRSPAGTKYICFAEKWKQAPWPCEIYEGGCEHKCAEGPEQSTLCFCPPGQSVNPSNNVSCEVDSDDPCVSLRCEYGCVDAEDGSHACICDHGFELAGDGRSCVDFNDCKDERQCPEDHQRCVNVHGGFECVCEDGYRMSGGDRCVDVDECMSAPCEHLCDNTRGGYRCSCFEGYKATQEAPEKCELYCGTEECPAECDPNNEFQCNCPLGYILDVREDGSRMCVDIDECEMFQCDEGCRNTLGSFVCSCPRGFVLVDQVRCVKAEDDAEGSGADAGTTPLYFITSTAPHPLPTRRPSQVTAGGLVGIILCVVVVILALVFLGNHICKRRGKHGGNPAEGKAQAGEGHDLETVTTEVREKQPRADT